MTERFTSSPAVRFDGNIGEAECFSGFFWVSNQGVRRFDEKVGRSLVAAAQRERRAFACIRRIRTSPHTPSEAAQRLFDMEKKCLRIEGTGERATIARIVHETIQAKPNSAVLEMAQLSVRYALIVNGAIVSNVFRYKEGVVEPVYTPHEREQMKISLDIAAPHREEIDGEIMRRVFSTLPPKLVKERRFASPAALSEADAALLEKLLHRSASNFVAQYSIPFNIETHSREYSAADTLLSLSVPGEGEAYDIFVVYEFSRQKKGE